MIAVDEEKLAEKEAVILEFARRSTLEPADITDEDFQKVKDVGYSDAEIMEAQYVMGLSTLETKFCDSLAFVPSRPEVLAVQAAPTPRRTVGT